MSLCGKHLVLDIVQSRYSEISPPKVFTFPKNVIQYNMKYPYCGNVKEVRSTKEGPSDSNNKSQGKIFTVSIVLRPNFYH